ncbi:MAG: glycosyltransferase family 61 protein [Bacteroidetes bacterium]|nr:MAG: glycosyltransferase family 61 protein [Bacteroidota bacterium]
MPAKTINVSPPVNLKEINCLYSKRSYDIFPLKVLNISNIDVTYDGICFKKSKIIKESVQAYPDKIRIFELEGKLQFKQRQVKYFVDKNQYLLIHHPWLNYYHWLTEVIPRIWLVKDVLYSLILLLPDHYKNIEFVQDSLKPFRFKEIIYVHEGYNMRIGNAVIPQIKPICSSYYPSVIFELRAFFLEYAKKNNIIASELGERVYIMRGNSLRRKIVNENALMEVLKKYDFITVDATSYSFFEQVLFSEKLKYLISNGSGLTNMHFMNVGTTVMELQKRITNENDFHDKVLWHLASALNLNYWFFICPPVNKKDDMYIADLKIDINKFDKLLTKML